jgi:NAD(P)-dependent dehydrogenase (short-subunit alcohol dehydrogenase family)
MSLCEPLNWATHRSQWNQKMATQLPGLGPDIVVLVTAGASGIGRCIAETFIEQGCRVHICDINTEALADFSAANPSASISHCNIGDSTQVSVMFEELTERYGQLDVLVNNAGVAGPTAAVEGIEIEAWDATINVDLNGTFYCSRLAAPLLKKRGGSMINMGTNAVFFGFPNRSAYTAAKWAINGLTKTWAMELGPFGVRVNALCPGSVNGPRIDAVIEADANTRGISVEAVREIYTRQSSMRLFVEAEDIANMAIFLASNMGRTVSGQSIGIDGYTESLSDQMS